MSSKPQFDLPLLGGAVHCVVETLEDGAQLHLCVHN